MQLTVIVLFVKRNVAWVSVFLLYHLMRSLIFILKEVLLFPLETVVVESIFKKKGLLKEEAIDEIPIYKNVTTMKKDEVKILLESLRVTSSKSLFDQLRDIKNVPETTCLNFTGFTKDELFFIKNELKSLYDTENRTKVQAVFIYLL